VSSPFHNSHLPFHCRDFFAGNLVDDRFGDWGREEDQGTVVMILKAYRKTPGTMGTIGRTHRVLAAQLHQRGICARVIENAFILAVTRHLMPPTEAPPLASIRSPAYFLPVIEEVLALHVSPDYFLYLRHKLELFTSTR
jgi:hypothetical protein